jgi:hypothetical protein
MNSLRKEHDVISRALCTIGLALIWTPSAAYAYLDPSAGSLLMQSLFALIGGLLAGLVGYWHQILGLVSRIKSKLDSARPTAAATSSQQIDEPPASS